MKPFNFYLIVIIVFLVSCKAISFLVDKDVNTNTHVNTYTNKIAVNISNATWFTKTLKTPGSTFGTVYLAIAGITNAERLTIRTYGDGRVGDRNIKLDANGIFNDTIDISFTHAIPPQNSTPKYSSTILMAYLGTEIKDTTLTSDALFYNN